MGMSLESRKMLSDGNGIPVLGLGVFQSEKGTEAEDAVLWAIEAGYRHVDTATAYNNEESVGAALKSCGIPREELFVTTKVWNEDQGYESTKSACRASLDRLQMDYVDLYLIHWPNDELTNDTWRAMMELRDEGLCRSIGVCNFGVERLERLLHESDVPPVIDQVELSPFLSQKAVRSYCAQHKIVVEGYSPLTRGQRLDHPVLAEVGQRHGKTPAQVMIRWAVQQDIVIFPKSVHKERILENRDVFDFELTQKDIQVLEELNENLVTSWRPQVWDGSV